MLKKMQKLKTLKEYCNKMFGIDKTKKYFQKIFETKNGNNNRKKNKHI